MQKKYQHRNMGAGDVVKTNDLGSAAQLTVLPVANKRIHAGVHPTPLSGHVKALSNAPDIVTKAAFDISNALKAACESPLTEMSQRQILDQVGPLAEQLGMRTQEAATAPSLATQAKKNQKARFN